MKKVILTLVIVAVLVFTGIGVLALWPKTIMNSEISGWQLRPGKWSGTITVTGDTRFVPWVTLSLDPGTRVLFKKDTDIPDTPWTEFADAYIKDHNDPTGREGYNQTHFDLVGQIVAKGTPEKPIIFTSAQTKPEYADWDQIVLFGGSVFEHVEVSYAHNGVYVGTDDIPFISRETVNIVRSRIHDSLWSCIDVWSMNTILRENEVYHCWHQGIGIKGEGENRIENNYIHDAQLSINCEHGANPLIKGNRFEAAPLQLDCPGEKDNQDIEQTADTRGGTYGGRLIYPSNFED